MQSSLRNSFDNSDKKSNKKLNFQYFIKSPEYGFSTKITYGNEEIKTKEELKKILKLYEININKDLSESLVNFTTYKTENGKVIVDKKYELRKISDFVTLTPYKQFLLDNIKTKGVSATKLQDNFYIEVGDVDNTLAAEITKATEEKAPEPVITEKPVENTSIEEESTADLDFLEQKEPYMPTVGFDFENVVATIKDNNFSLINGSLDTINKFIRNGFKVYIFLDEQAFKNGFASLVKEWMDKQGFDKSFFITNSLAAINIKELSTWDNFSIKIYCGLNDFLGIRKEKCDTNIYNIDKININFL
jgi:hypothetical protein